MAVIVKTHTFVANAYAYASEVNRNFDNIYTEFNGNINSANIIASFTWPASQMTINDTAAYFSSVEVEGAMAELNSRLPSALRSVILEYSEGRVGIVGSASQHYAGHLWSLDEPGTTASDVIALYLFGNAADVTKDETNNNTLAGGGVVPQTAAGIFGSGNAISVTGGNSTNLFMASTLLDNASSIGSIAIDFWIDPTGISSTASRKYVFSKINVSAKDYIGCCLDTAGYITFEAMATGSTAFAIRSVTQAPSATSGNNWMYVCVNKDTANGMRMWVNGVLEAINTSATERIGNGTDKDFIIGNGWYVSASYSYQGKIGMFRVRNKTLSQFDVDIAYAQKYVRSANPTGLDFGVKSFAMPNADSANIVRFDMESMEIHRNASSIYFAGGVVTGLSQNDRIKIILE